MTPKQRRLSMKVAGGLVKHLGLHMYSGAVPAIAELVSNAWDAMASHVRIDIPLDRPLDASDVIVVRDNGHGMTFDECDNEYLVIGRDRRASEGDLSRAYKKIPRRRLMSRKGIGKLAGFGIANLVDVRTVRSRKVTHFALDFEKIVKSGKFVDKYRPEMFADDGTSTKESDGTTIKLTGIKITRAISEAQFRSSLARRFTVLTADAGFQVLVNDKIVKRSEQPFQFRYPAKKGQWKQDVIPGDGRKVRWWVGFRQDPIPDDDARGISVFARGKLAQAPWFFGLTGGAYGQHGMQYMTGEVVADFLDETNGADLIATDRGSALWEDPAALELKTWGEAKVRELLREWADRRHKTKVRRPEVLKYLQLVERLPDKERVIFEQFVDRVTSIPQIDKDDVIDELVRFGYNALTNIRFFEVIRQLNAISAADRDQVAQVLSEGDVIEAIQTAQKVKGRVEIIRTFSAMIEAGVPEKPDMHEFLKSHPWLIQPQWETLHHEKSLDTVLEKQFHTKKTKSKAGQQRLDFFCLAAARQWEVVEIKRPGLTVGQKELDQVRDYVFFLREEGEKNTNPDTRVHGVNGILVYSDIAAGMSQHVKALDGLGIHVTTWQDLLRTTESLHREFLEVVKKRAPSDDPRMQDLAELSSAEA